MSLSPVNLYSYESTGFLNQSQFIVNVSRRFSGRVGLFGYYVYNRASSDIRHRVVIGGAVLAPFGVTFSPFLIARSGAPFNITTGNDATADTLFTGRPTLATNLAAPGVIATNFGAFDLTPGPSEPVIARNFGEGPGFFTVNLRASRTFGFGEVRADKKKRKKGPKRGGLPGNMTDLDSVNLESMFRDASTEHRYNMTLSVVARNLFNTVNSGLPAGSLSSPIFGRSNALASTTAPDGSYYGDNRRLQFQIRFAF